MRNLIMVVLVLAAVAYAVSGISTMWKVRNDFQARVDQRCSAVTESNSDAIKQTLLQDAGKLGLKLAPADIRISYVDAPGRSLAQSIVGDRLGTQFVNKRATIHCRALVPVLGVGMSQEFESSQMIQVKAVQSRGKGELETQMDAAPPL